MLTFEQACWTRGHDQPIRRIARHVSGLDHEP